MQTMIGVIGGSGLYQVDGLEGASWVKVKSPWGKPSDEVLVGRMQGVPMAFLPRHGRGHAIAPSDINARANIDALKRLGCSEIIAVSAVGSLRQDFRPGDVVIVDQVIDRTFARPKSFFGTGCVAHVSFAQPVCARLSRQCLDAAQAAGARVHLGATYLAMEGPQFSTLAESQLYRSWGADVIGMTAMPEAGLAREAELCYALVGLVTDYDCWHPAEGAVDVAQVLATLSANAGRARALVAGLPQRLAAGATATERPRCPQGCDHALDGALMTAPDQRDPDLLAKLDAVAGRVLKG